MLLNKFYLFASSHKENYHNKVEFSQFLFYEKYLKMFALHHFHSFPGFLGKVKKRNLLVNN
jgi:hypothetical protein